FTGTVSRLEMVTVLVNNTPVCRTVANYGIDPGNAGTWFIGITFLPAADMLYAQNCMIVINDCYHPCELIIELRCNSYQANRGKFPCCQHSHVFKDHILVTLC